LYLDDIGGFEQWCFRRFEKVNKPTVSEENWKAYALVRRESAGVVIFPEGFLPTLFLPGRKKVGPGAGKLARSRQGAKKRKYVL